MANMSDRQKAFENKFAHDQDMKFRIIARRNKMLGLWAAAALGRDDADAYAREVVESDFEEAGDDDVLRKVVGDFEAGRVKITAGEVREKMDQLLAEATASLAG